MHDLKRAVERNQSMECAKLIASCFVVFIHYRFPGRIGELVAFIGNFAVPMFFMITGYFNYRASCDQILKRAKKMAGLYLWGAVVHILWIAICCLRKHTPLLGFILRLMPDQEGLTGWFTYQKPFLAGHLWYLHAMVIVYLLYWAYTRFTGEERHSDQGLYIAGFVTFMIFFVTAVVMRLGDEPELFIYRHAYVMGMAFFTAGVFCREYQHRLFECFAFTNKKLIAVMVLGLLLTVQQWIRCCSGYSFGTIISVFALLLLMASNPRIVSCGSIREKLIKKCGAWSVWIYIFHEVISQIYMELFQPGLYQWMGEAERLFYPLLVLLGSWVTAAAMVEIQTGLRALGGKRK